MEAKELMIGDWVINPIHNDCVKIEGVYFDKELHSHVASDGRFPQIYFEAIPLTPEILNANGWQKNDPHWVSTLRRYCDKDGSKWSLSFTLQKGIWDAYIHNDGDLNINKFHPMYVHELQHALRLCGLNDLADNFKIS